MINRLNKRDVTALDLTPVFHSASADQIKLLLHQLVRVCLASITIAFLVVIFLWQHANQQWLIIWFATIFLISLTRIFLVRTYYSQVKHQANTNIWQWTLLTLVLLAAISWGAIAFFYDFNWHPAPQLAEVSVLIIIAAGAIPAYATILPLYISVLLLLFAPLTALFLLSGQQHYLYFGAGLVVLGFIWCFFCETLSRCCYCSVYGTPRTQ